MKKKIVRLFSALLLFSFAFELLKAQDYDFSQSSEILGKDNPQRSAYDVLFYDLNLRILPTERKIRGSNLIRYRLLAQVDSLQIDLSPLLEIDSILNQKGEKIAFTRYQTAVKIPLSHTTIGQQSWVQVFYQGSPLVAQNPPWQGGFSWEKDANGNDWIGVSCQGIGAQTWFPCKEVLTDKPDSVRLTFEVPTPLFCVANGNLQAQTELSDGFTRYQWATSYPINTYNITLNVGNYAHFSDYFKNQSGEKLDLDYYVLAYQEKIAKPHFKQVKEMLAIYEKLLGAYPFPKDGFALVETPYLGMEHQSAIAYGNGYQNNRYDFDYIIIHESGHEYFGNSLTATDIGEMWIHEAFTTYLEALFVEEKSGYAQALRYLAGQRVFIKNDAPIVAPLGLRYFSIASTDMYYKGSWFLHTLRHVVDDTPLWKQTLRDFYQTYKHRQVSTAEVIDFFVQKLEKKIAEKQKRANVKAIFEQYLYYAKPPIFQYCIEKVAQKADSISYRLHYRWQTDVPNFEMPLPVLMADQKPLFLDSVTNLWQHYDFSYDLKQATSLAKRNGQPDFFPEIAFFEDKFYILTQMTPLQGAEGEKEAKAVSEKSRDLPAIVPELDFSPKTDTTMSTTIRGKVTFQDLEGGFWGIISHEGKSYKPDQMPAELQKQGLEVEVEAEEIKGFSIFMWGTNIRIISYKIR
ncbi:M1 family metallopeptidase [Hugenholtzia roseola]|uniref:M1 family metallopeptidase n=1 Tax=Hugenholtzia roseola TaxID=1002 RepID=UPI0004137F99|nr:M1 family metallopeptidase [Hugenholtzia roseola]